MLKLSHKEGDPAVVFPFNTGVNERAGESNVHKSITAAFSICTNEHYEQDRPYRSKSRSTHKAHESRFG